MYTLKKSLGQHFLKDENICRKIVSAVQQHPFTQLLEVGPGGGALTKYLLELKEIDFKAVELDDEKVETICNAIEEVVVPANYNWPGQLVISSSLKGIEIACEQLKNAGAKRALVLPVGGAFHSPLMMHAEEELIAAIEKANFYQPVCPVYQNVAAKAVIRPEEIKMNLIHQLTGPVRWTQSVQSMIADGATRFTEAGPGKVLQGLVLKINKEMQVEGVNWSA